MAVVSGAGKWKFETELLALRFGEEPSNAERTTRWSGFRFDAGGFLDVQHDRVQVTLRKI